MADKGIGRRGTFGKWITGVIAEAVAKALLYRVIGWLFAVAVAAVATIHSAPSGVWV